MHCYGHGRQADVVVLNPDFCDGMQALTIALLVGRMRSVIWSERQSNVQALRDDGRIVALLPSDYFEGVDRRAAVYRMLDICVEHEFKLGHQSFYGQQQYRQKRT
jgi:hypothetical protein